MITILLKETTELCNPLKGLEVKLAIWLGKRQAARGSREARVTSYAQVLAAKTHVTCSGVQRVLSSPLCG